MLLKNVIMAYSEQNIRNAAEVLLRSNEYQNPQSPNLDLSYAQSVNTNPSIRQEYVLSEDISAGYHMHGRMSDVRRFFCLFVTFDLLFTGLMWLICIMLHGENIMVALKEQVLHYDVHTSLFDIVMAAICRFTVLLLFYALLHINHWIVISISTAGTCVFLIAKVFCYDWQKSNQPVFEVLLVLVSFVLAWGETWFLDCRVLPQEFYAKQFFIRSPTSERAPLLQNYLQNLPSVYTESVANFYSPLASPEGSVRRMQTLPTRSCYLAVTLTKAQEDKYRKQGSATLKTALLMLQSQTWKPAKENSSEGDNAYTMTTPDIGKIYLIKGTINVTPEYLVQEVFCNIDSMAQWNNTILESQKVQVVDEHTDIIYQILADAAGGIISSRDFLSVRHWQMVEENTYVLAFKTTDHPSVPKTPKYVRAESSIGCWRFSPIEGEENMSKVEWMLNTNLNGWLPKQLVNTALMGTMFAQMKLMREHTERQWRASHKFYDEV